MTMTLSIPADELRMVPLNGMALATIADGSLVIHVEPINGAAIWMVLTKEAADWLREQLRKFES